ncbi:hypothetical protein ACT3SZ_00970 [Corynebacterium sp. AOP40-9SA-29]|uniref:hypothetical protein n=1 Tax=Corynebacterium sp. AOP40-9SA-29 TaxID=3457677 RepID=UPI004034482B
MTVSLPSMAPSTWKCALITGLTVPALALTGCSFGEDSDDSGDDAASSDVVEEDTDESELLTGLTLDGAPGGFRPTAPGTELDVDEPAYVVTRQAGGQEAEDAENADEAQDAQDAPLQFWKVTALRSSVVDADEVALTEGADDVDHFLCLPYEVEFLGAGEGAELVAPVPYPAEDEGTAANVVERADPTVCGVDEEDLLPSDMTDFEVGTTYSGAALSYVDKERTRGINPTGLAFAYALAADADADADDTDEVDDTDTEGTENTEITTVEDLDGTEPILWN